jgi:hypothetical protein
MHALLAWLQTFKTVFTPTARYTFPKCFFVKRCQIVTVIMSSSQIQDTLTQKPPCQPANVYLKPTKTTNGSDLTDSDFSSYLQSQRQSLVSSKTTLSWTTDDEYFDKEKLGIILSESEVEDHNDRVKRLGDLNTMVKETPEFSDPDGTKLRRAQRLMKVRKMAFQCCIFGLK